MNKNVKNLITLILKTKKYDHSKQDTNYIGLLLTMHDITAEKYRFFHFSKLTNMSLLKAVHLVAGWDISKNSTDYIYAATRLYESIELNKIKRILFKIKIYILYGGIKLFRQ